MVFDNLLVAHSTLPVQTQLNADEPERERMVHRISRLLAPVDFSYRTNRYKERLIGLPLMKQGSHRKVPAWRILSSRVNAVRSPRDCLRRYFAASSGRPLVAMITRASYEVARLGTKFAFRRAESPRRLRDGRADRGRRESPGRSAAGEISLLLDAPAPARPLPPVRLRSAP